MIESRGPHLAGGENMTFARDLPAPKGHGFRYGTPQLRTLLSAALGNRARVGAGDLKPGNWLGLVWIS